MNTWTFGFGWIDIRVRGASFGNVNIDDVWQHYFHWDLESYHKSQQIKFQLDPDNILSNSFTIKPYGMTQTKVDFQTYIFNDFQNDKKLLDVLYFITKLVMIIVIGCIGWCCWRENGSKRKCDDTKTI